MDRAAPLVVGSPDAEQSWNSLQMASPVLEPRLAFWTYDLPGVVLGCSQRRLHACLDGAMGAVVRGSGGGAVLTGPWLLSVSLVLPPAHALVTSGPIDSYRWFGLAHARALRCLGIAATAIPPENIPPAVAGPDLSWACYSRMSAWEVAVDGRKIVGLAQLRRRTGVLLTSGTLVGAPDWQLLCERLGKPPEQAKALVQGTTSCEAELGRPGLPRDVVFAAMERELSGLMDLAWKPAGSVAMPRASLQAA